MCFKKAAWIGLCSTFSTQIFLTPFSPGTSAYENWQRNTLSIGSNVFFPHYLMGWMKCELCFIINVYLILHFEETYEVMGLECLALLVGSHWTRNMGMLQKQSGGDVAGWSMHSVILLSAVLPETVNEEFLNSSNVCVRACVCVCVRVWHR